MYTHLLYIYTHIYIYMYIHVRIYGDLQGFKGYGFTVLRSILRLFEELMVYQDLVWRELSFWRSRRPSEILQIHLFKPKNHKQQLSLSNNMYESVKQTQFRRRRQVALLAFEAPNQGLESRVPAAATQGNGSHKNSCLFFADTRVTPSPPTKKMFFRVLGARSVKLNV